MKSGRPKEIDKAGKETGCEVINVRVTRTQKERIREMANNSGVGIGEYVRRNLLGE